MYQLYDATIVYDSESCGYKPRGYYSTNTVQRWFDKDNHSIELLDYEEACFISRVTNDRGVYNLKPFEVDDEEHLPKEELERARELCRLMEERLELYGNVVMNQEIYILLERIRPADPRDDYAYLCRAIKPYLCRIENDTVPLYMVRWEPDENGNFDRDKPESVTLFGNFIPEAI